MNYDIDDEFSGPSKSQRKRDAHQQQELGTRLTTCREAHLQALELPDVLLAAIAEFKKLPNRHGARRRQLQFIGKLMRDRDCDTIGAALDRLESFQPPVSKTVPATEIWTDQILASGDSAINALLDANPDFERQKLRQLYRDCQSGDETSRAGYREKLKRYLASLL